MIPGPHILFLNTGCHPQCSICDACEPPRSIMAVTNEIATMPLAPNEHLYVGTEAFADLDRLRQVLSSCRARDVTPFLVTSGQFFCSPEDLTKLFVDMLAVCRFRLLLVLDNAHVSAMDGTRVGDVVRAAKRAFIIPPEIIFLLRVGERLPTSLLDCDEINRFVTIHTKKFDTVRSLLVTHKGQRTAARRDEVASEFERADYDVSGGSERGVRQGEASVATIGDHCLNFNALVLETTHFCNAKCDHCYTSCGPDRSKYRMAVGDIKRIIDDAAILPNLKKRCHVGGGEATLFWDELIETLGHAKSRGFANSIVTNGFWGRTEKLALKKVGELKECGVQTIEFSVDAMHQQFVSPSVVSNVIRAAKHTGVMVMLRISTTKSNRATGVLEQLNGEDQVDISIANSRVVPIGRARTAIAAEDIWTNAGIPVGACHEMLNLTVTENGDVFPCCAGSEICPSLALGNCLERPLSEIMRSLRSNFLVRTLVHAGPSYFAALILEAGLGGKLLPGYANFCHLCNQICSDSELSEFVKAKVAENVHQVLLDLTRSVVPVGSTG